MAADFTIKKDDTLPVLLATLKDATGKAIPLTNASVTFRMRPIAGGAVKVSAAATIVSAGSGKVKYTWLAGDTDTPGTYNAEFVISYSGSLLSVPNDSDFTVLVHDPI